MSRYLIADEVEHVGFVAPVREFTVQDLLLGTLSSARAGLRLKSMDEVKHLFDFLPPISTRPVATGGGAVHQEDASRCGAGTK